MSDKTIAFVTGASGQDGSNLIDYLLSLGTYEIHGTIRRQSVAENQTSRLRDVEDRVSLHYADVTDAMCMAKLIGDIHPNEVYHLAGQSHVRVSSDIPKYTVETNAIGTLNVLQAIHHECPTARSYTAASSECFGRSVEVDGYQRETTRMNPTSPYGCSKVFAYNITRHYRFAYGQFAANGILFNHTSRRRTTTFVEAKIAKTLAEIAARKTYVLELGNVDAHRDWGSSRDYVRAMHAMLQQPESDDFVVATGETYSVWDFVLALSAEFGLDPKHCVKTGTGRYLRPQELPYLRGDASKARRILGWKPTQTFGDIVKELADHWRAEVARNS